MLREGSWNTVDFNWILRVGKLCYVVESNYLSMRWFQTLFVQPSLGEIIQIDDHVFSKGLVQPMIFSFNWVGSILIFQGWRFAKTKYHGKIREKMWGPPLGEYPVVVCSLKIPPYSLYKPYTAGTWWYKVGVLLEGVPTFSIWEDHCCPSPSKLSRPEMRVEFRLTAIVFL